jgi:hypothetical protein
MRARRLTRRATASLTPNPGARAAAWVFRELELATCRWESVGRKNWNSNINARRVRAFVAALDNEICRSGVNGGLCDGFGGSERSVSCLNGVGNVWRRASSSRSSGSSACCARATRLCRCGGCIQSHDVVLRYAEMSCHQRSKVQLFMWYAQLFQLRLVYSHQIIVGL